MNDRVFRALALTSAFCLAILLGRVRPLDAQTSRVRGLVLEDAGSVDLASAREHNRLGAEYLATGKLEQAEAEFKLALSTDPHCAEALNNLAVLRGRQKKYGESEQLLRQAIQSSPEYVEGYVNLGLLLAREQRLNEAEKEIAKAIEIAPSDPAAHTAMGSVHAKLGRLEEAARDFQKAVQLEPKSAEAHLNLGIALAEESGANPAYLDEALGEFTAAARLDPTSAAARYHQGRTLFNLGRYSEAEPDLEASLKLDPAPVATLYLLGLTESELGHTDRSTELLEQTVAREPRNADARYFLGREQFRAGRTGEAISQWRQAAETNPEQASALYSLSLALRKSNPEEAQNYGLRYFAVQNRHQVTHLAESSRLSAEAAAQRGDWRGAVQYLHEALKICGECSLQADLRKSLGLAYCYAGDLDDGELELARVLKVKPNDPDVQRATEIIEQLKHDHGAPRK